MKKKKKVANHKFYLTIKLMTGSGIWETQSIPVTISKTKIRPIGVVVYKEKRKGEVVYLTEYVV